MVKPNSGSQDEEATRSAEVTRPGAHTSAHRQDSREEQTRLFGDDTPVDLTQQHLSLGDLDPDQTRAPIDAGPTILPSRTQLPSGPGEEVTAPGTLRTESPRQGTGLPVQDSDLTGAGVDTIVPGGPEEGPLAPGHAFGSRYHIISVIGVGGMGAVYRAWDQELGVLVALKVIRPEVAADPEAARALERRFKQELLLAREVTHRNVVRIHDLGEVHGIKYITMPFIEGEDLASILKREGSLPVSRIMPIARTMVSGLVAAHKAGIVHRDLKPANIMVDGEGQAMIMDFGVARRDSAAPAAVPGSATADVPAAMRAAAATAQTVVGSVVGTIDYMAPEQARAQPVDQRADIYAVGLILYDLLLGRKRHEHAQSAIAELQERMQTAPQPPRAIKGDIPEALDAIVERCLQPDPAARFQTTEELEIALNRLDDEGKPLPVMRRLTRRMMAAIAALVLVLVVGAFYTAKWLTAPVKPHDPVSVMIADFQNTTNDPAIGRTLGSTVRRALESASFISAYDRSRLSVFGVRAPEKFDETAARELAVKQGLGVILAGSVGPDGSGYDIAVKAMQPVTGDVIANVSGTADSKDQVLETATRLVARVRKALGDRTSESAQLFAMRTLSASSLGVVSLYAEALEAQSQGKYEDARQRYLRTIELDPKFGLGYQGLAAMSRNLGRTEDAEKYSKEALRYLDGLTERERFATRGYYYRTIGDNQQCVKEFGELLTRYPGDAVSRSLRAGCFLKLRRMQDAVNEMRQATQMLPNHVGFRGNLALLYDLAGNFDAAQSELERIPEANRPLLPLAYSYVGRGLLNEAAATYQKLGATGPSGASSAAAGLGDLAVYEGHFSEAARIFEEGAAADLAAKSTTKAGVKYASAAYADLLRGEGKRAAAAAQKAVDQSSAMPVRFLAARIFVEVGELDKAEAVAKALSSELPAEPQAHGKIIEGLIALKKGNARDAIKILSDANALLDTWLGHFDLGRAYLAAGAFVQADSEFDVCLTRRGEALSLMDEGATYGYLPPVYYYQGRVREEMKTASFGDAYREYLKIRGASTEDPLVPDVRKRAGQ